MGFPTMPVVALAAMMMGPAFAAPEGKVLWVDAAAKAGGDGSAARPFVSPVEAVSALRAESRGARTAEVRVRPGTYFLPEGLVLDARDSRVRFVSDGDGDVVFTRAEKVTPGGTVRCDAGRAPDTEWYGGMKPHAPMFFYDDKWAVEARWPNRGWAMFKKDQVVDSGLRGRCLSGIAPDDPTVAGSLRFDSDRPARWDWAKDDIRICGYMTHDWSFEMLRLASYTPSNRLVRLAGAAPYGLGGSSWSEYPGHRYYIVGPRSELDAPGEYYYDRRTGKVDFIAPKGMWDFYAVTKEGPLVSLTGASDVTFDGIRFEYAVGNGFTLKDCTNVVVRNCCVWNVGGRGVQIDGGARCRVERTEIAAIGFGGLHIVAGDRPTLTRCDHVVEDCDINDFSRTCRTYAPAVRVQGVGVTVRGCKIHNAPHAGVLYGGNDHLFESNEVWGILYESGDAGAFYTGRDPTSRGNVLRGNYVHDVGRPENGSRNTMAFYLDDCDAGDTIVSNRIVNVPRGIMLGGGHDNHLVGNVFERCNLAISVDARGVVWNDRWDSPTDKSWQMTRKVKETPVDREPWKSRYPLLVDYLDDGPREPRHCSIVGNRFIGCGVVWEWGMRADEFRHLIEMRDNVERPLSPTVAKLPAKPTLPKDEIFRRGGTALAAAGRGASLQAAAEKALADRPTPFPDDLYLEYWTTGDRMRFQGWKSRLCANLAILAAAEIEEGRGRWLRGIEERLNAICDMKSWVHPAHDWGDGGKGAYNGTRLTVDLGCASIGATLACVLRELDGKLDAKVRQRVVEEVWRRIVKPLWREIPFHICQGGDPLQFDHIDHWWISTENNWNAVCWDDVLCTVLGIVDDARIRAYFVDAAIKSLPLYIGGFGADGYCSEGMGYWNYGFGHHLRMGLMLREVSGGKIDVFILPKQRLIAQYALGYRLAERVSPAFADGCGAPTEENLKMVAEVWPDLDASLPPETRFGSSQVWLWRDPQGVSVAFKGGHNGELHNHNDVGSYWVMVADKFAGGDPGSEVYTRRTFSSERYDSKVISSYGHPVPVVGGALQRTGSTFAAKVVAAEADRVTLDLKGAYDVKTLKVLTRTFSYDRKTKTLMIHDHVEFTEPTAFESPFNTYLQQDNDNLGARLDPWAKRYELDLPVAWNVRPEVKAQGGAWRLVEETIPNPGRWAPHRVAVRFDQPVKTADVVFVYEN